MTSKKGNTLTLWGNESTMNLNSLVLTNIQSSPYFKNGLIKLKTYHEVIDEIYYKVDHLEPWERGSRQTAGQVGMCGGVRGVGCGGIVSSAFCLLFKLYTLKLTRKQVNGLLTHSDSPFIRGLGFMYVRYSAPPADLFDWFEPYLDDEEEIDPKAGTGAPMTIGEMLRCFLTKQDWFSTLFPRIPVPIMKDIERRMPPRNVPQAHVVGPEETNTDDTPWGGESERATGRDRRRSSPDIKRPRSQEKHKNAGHDRRRSLSQDRGKSRSKDRKRSKSPERKRSRSRDRVHRSRSRDGYRSKEHQRRSPAKELRRSRSRERRRSPHRSHTNSRKHDFSDALQRERLRQEKEVKKHPRSRSRSRDREEQSKRKERSRRDDSEHRERKKNKKSKKHKKARSRSLDVKRSSSQDR